MSRQFLVSNTVRLTAIVVTAGILIVGAIAVANTSGDPKTNYTEQSSKAVARYEADKKLCAEETSTDARLQCRRDAKAAYDKTLEKAKAKLANADKAKASTSAVAPPAAPALCKDCGTVTAVAVQERDGEGGPIGIIAGGVGGAILGNQVGGGVGKDIATVAGAVGGAYAGKKIEEKVRAYKVWTVSVRYADKTVRHFEFRNDPNYEVGDAVENAGNSITRR
jgi:outer membrane lipoprotein SlyB